MDGVGSPPGQNSGSFFTPFVISMVGMAASTLALVAYHLLVVKYCIGRRQRQSIIAESQTLPDLLFVNGIEEKDLLAVPILPYSTEDGNVFLADQRECVICLGELEDGEMVRLLPSCRHAFHVPCIDNWFSGHRNCPVCRSPVVEPRSTFDEAALAIGVGDRNEEEIESSLQFHGQEDGRDSLITSAGDGSASSSRVESYSSRFLRHSVSLALPMEGKQQLLPATLKRSLSMDQYSYVLINVRNEMPKLQENDESVRQLERMSSRLVRSLSQLRTSSSSSIPTANNNHILPY